LQESRSFQAFPWITPHNVTLSDRLRVTDPDPENGPKHLKIIHHVGVMLAVAAGDGRNAVQSCLFLRISAALIGHDA